MSKKVLTITLLTVSMFFICNVTFAGLNVYSKRKQIQINRYEKIVLLMKRLKLMGSSQRQLTDLEKLGKQIYEDLNLSSGQNQACSSCHNSSAHFADPDNIIAPTFRPVSQGSDMVSFGGRNAPTASYSGFSPKLHWEEDPAGGGLFIGGVFWDGRASGQASTATATGDELGRTEPTGDPIADQAKGPFLNPVEMNLQQLEDVVNTVMDSDYRKKFLLFYGKEVCEGYNVLKPNSCNNINVPKAYNKIAIAIAAFERSPQLNKFNSRFDMFANELILKGQDINQFGIEVQPDGFRKYVGPPANFKSIFLTYDEADGLALFNADSEVQLFGAATGNVGGMCYLCHLTEPHNADYGQNSIQKPGLYPPLLTDFSYDNLGIPKNPRIAELAGPQADDLGLGGAGRENELLALNPNAVLADEAGKFKVSTLRNIAKTAPYGHNGFFPDLYSIVHFYNVRDVVDGDFKDVVFEVPDTVNIDELGNLGLNFEQEKKLVKFLMTLSDL